MHSSFVLPITNRFRFTFMGASFLANVPAYQFVLGCHMVNRCI